jgi:polyisoprenoid-binding protein YceI
MKRWMKWTIAAVAAVVALGIGAVFLYTEVLNDPEDELTTEDLSEAVTGTATTAPESTAPGSTAPGSTAPASTAVETTTVETTAATTAASTATTAAATAGGDGSVDGAWAVTSDSEFGYRVEEVLFGANTTATGRSNAIEGTMTIDGTTVTDGEFTVDVATIESDQERRDNQFRDRIMEVDQFPDATFTLTEPIDFGAVPAAGEQLTASATGDLTLHGVTRSVTFDVTAEAGNGRLGVLGNIPVLFSDYDIDNPSNGAVATEDNGLLEFILVFEPA